MALRSLCLHPVHLDPDGEDLAPQALTWGTAPGSRAERLEKLTQEATAFLRDCQKDLKDRTSGDYTILKSRNHIIFRHQSARDVQVPLLLSEVGYACEEETSVVALARPCSDRSGDQTQFKVWLFVVSGGDLGLRTLLQVLAGGGAIRGDFEQTYDVSSCPFAAGACACVYKVAEKIPRDSRQSEVLAAKALRVGQPGAVAKAEMEMKLLCKAQGHPNVNQFIGSFYSYEWAGQESDWTSTNASKEDDEKHGTARFRLVMVIELCNRGSVQDRVLQCGAYSEGEALEVMRGLLSALEHVHEKGIVHRDVKPENLLRGADGRPVLTDFGISAFVSDNEAMQERCGTPGYAAPELLTTNSTYGTKVDVFGAGGVLYFCHFGSPPFGTKHAPAEQVIDETVRTDVKFRDFCAITEQMRQFILILLTKNPADRPSATGALNVLKLFPCPKCEPAEPKPVKAPKAKGRAAVGGDVSANHLTPLAPPSPPPGQQKRRPSLGRPLLRCGVRGASEQQEERPSGQERASGQQRSYGGSSRGRSSSNFRLWFSRSEDKAPYSSDDTEDGLPMTRQASAPSAPSGSRGNGASQSWFHRGRKVSAATPETAEQLVPKQPVPMVDRLRPSFLVGRRSETTAAASTSS